MAEYLVTIGMPVYNVERYIRRSLESALAQTFPSIEFLICDDCGTDSSIDIVKELQQQHPRGKDIRIVRQERNMGIGAGRNRMMDEAKGRYFYSMDADDIIVPETIELLYRAINEYQAEVAYGSYERVYEHDGQIVGREPFPYPKRLFTAPDEYASFVYYEGVQCMNWNFLMNLEVVRRNGLRVTAVGHGYGEDFTYTIDLPTYITRAVLLPDVTYQYFNRTFSNRVKPKKQLSHKQLLLAIDAIDRKKRRDELKGKPYYAKRMAHLMMFDCSFACEMLGRRKSFDIPFTNREIRDVMWHPMTLSEILRAPAARVHNLFYWLLSKSWPWLCVLLLQPIIKRYGVKKH